VISGLSDRGFMSCNGANDRLSVEHLWPLQFPEINNVVSPLPSGPLRKFHHVHITGFFNCTGLHCSSFYTWIKSAQSLGISLSLDPQFDATGTWTARDTVAYVLSCLDIFMPNEMEAIGIADAHSRELAHPTTLSITEAIENAANIIASLMKPNSLLIIKCGEKGAIVWKIHRGWKEHIVSCPSFPTLAIDMTGAGDAFNSGFLASLLTRQELPSPSVTALERAMELGCAAGALRVSVIGGCDKAPSMDVLCKFVCDRNISAALVAMNDLKVESTIHNASAFVSRPTTVHSSGIMQARSSYKSHYIRTGLYGGACFLFGVLGIPLLRWFFVRTRSSGTSFE